VEKIIFKMMTAKQTFLSTFLVIILCVANDGAGSRTAVQSKPGRQQLISSLRKRLKIVRTAHGKKPIEMPGGDDVSLLVGMSRTEIKSALGQPQVCHVPIEYAPCKGDGDWFYSFYYMADYNGGGPELYLTFDNKEISKTAQWIFTQ